ncbi:MAG TPA: ROK family protein [Bacillota bacterium]|nr:ROK family protein [Bacillota bacterium]HPJ85996.1 ROK family protein [Bacillota bacterium]HPQ61983.1 ROK family protein [Bacillota bacterium]HRX92117.1 ROK family protein [Candidatus Izemoplasmatales bacterium]
MPEYLLGIDIGGTSVKIGLFNLEGFLLDKRSIITDRSQNGSHILRDIAVFIKKNWLLSSIAGIGLGVPGPVKNNIVETCVNLGWGITDPKTELNKYFNYEDIAIKVTNDASAAALGEYAAGAAKGYSNVVLLTLGTGIGGGVIIDGRLHEGVDGISGEFGHIVVDKKHAFLCNCGKRGCLETVASATGIARLAKYNLDNTDFSSKLRNMDSFSAKTVFDLAKEKDEVAVLTIDEAADNLAAMLGSITLTIDPDLFVLAGGVSLAGDYLLQSVKRHYPDYIRPFDVKAGIVLATLGSDAGIYGAMQLVK